mmetsp:Transcript_4717/g.11308  ORF Transcript_4717/g.11308 Transcript_4717/m.11308 type:complete len:293 (-) Transcript_4717:1557-2435(-)
MVSTDAAHGCGGAGAVQAQASRATGRGGSEGSSRDSRHPYWRWERDPLSQSRRRFSWLPFWPGGALGVSARGRFGGGQRVELPERRQIPPSSVRSGRVWERGPVFQGGRERDVRTCRHAEIRRADAPRPGSVCPFLFWGFEDDGDPGRRGASTEEGAGAKESGRTGGRAQAHRAAWRLAAPAPFPAFGWTRAARGAGRLVDVFTRVGGVSGAFRGGGSMGRLYDAFGRRSDSDHAPAKRAAPPNPSAKRKPRVLPLGPCSARGVRIRVQLPRRAGERSAGLRSGSSRHASAR